MSERVKETDFLCRLLGCDDTSEQQDELQSRLLQADRAIASIRRASRRVFLLTLLALAGLGYSVVFLEEVVQRRSHVLLQCLFALLLGCLLSLIAYLVCWLCYRAHASGIQEQCRRLLLERTRTRHEHEATFLRIACLADHPRMLLQHPNRESIRAGEILPAVRAP